MGVRYTGNTALLILKNTNYWTMRLWQMHSQSYVSILYIRSAYLSPPTMSSYNSIALPINASASVAHTIILVERKHLPNIPNTTSEPFNPISKFLRVCSSQSTPPILSSQQHTLPIHLNCCLDKMSLPRTELHTDSEAH